MNELTFKDINKDFEIGKREVSHGSYCLPGTTGGICVDVGSNVGAFASLCRDSFDTIHCIEPSAECMRQAIQNLQRDGATNVVLHKHAVAKESGKKIKLYRHGTGSSMNSTTETHLKDQNYDFSNGEEVDTVSLEFIKDSIAGGEEIKFLKVDCEGAEYELLYGKDLSNIRWLGIELHASLSDKKLKALTSHIEKYFTLWYGRRASAGATHFEVTYVSKKLMQKLGEGLTMEVDYGKFLDTSMKYEKSNVVGGAFYLLRGLAKELSGTWPQYK